MNIEKANQYIEGWVEGSRQAMEEYHAARAQNPKLVPVLDKAPEWNGHTPDDAISRIESLRSTCQHQLIVKRANDDMNAPKKIRLTVGLDDSIVISGSDPVQVALLSYKKISEYLSDDDVDSVELEYSKNRNGDRDEVEAILNTLKESTERDKLAADWKNVASMSNECAREILMNHYKHLYPYGSNGNLSPVQEAYFKAFTALKQLSTRVNR